MIMCKRKSCIYHAGNKIHGCNYIFITGQSKLGQMKKGETYTIENCKFYENGKKRSATKQVVLDASSPDEVLRQANTVDGELVTQYYSADLCDADIAMLLNVSQRAIVKIRRQKGLLRSMSKGGSIRRINWDEVDSMLEEGYSDIAVALYIKVPLEVIQRYKNLTAKKKSEGGIEHGDETNHLQQNPV